MAEGPELGLPYRPRTRQEEGAVTEKRVAKKYGARVHPRSGAGRIKEDASNDTTLIEVKDANKTFTLNGEHLLTTFLRAVRQGRNGMWVITFANGIEAEINLTMKGGGL